MPARAVQLDSDGGDVAVDLGADTDFRNLRFMPHDLVLLMGYVALDGNQQDFCKLSGHVAQYTISMNTLSR
jgi:hypothetical protein